MAGNQPRLTANSRISTIAATNAGMAAEMVVATSAPVSRTPGRSPASDAERRCPAATMISDA